MFWALLLSSEHSGVPEDSKPPTFPNVGPPHLAKVGLRHLWFFVDPYEDSIMMDDAIMLSNPLITLVGEEEFKETLFDVNVS